MGKIVNNFGVAGPLKLKRALVCFQNCTQLLLTMCNKLKKCSRMKLTSQEKGLIYSYSFMWLWEMSERGVSREHDLQQQEVHVLCHEYFAFFLWNNCLCKLICIWEGYKIKEKGSKQSVLNVNLCTKLKFFWRKQKLQNMA